MIHKSCSKRGYDRESFRGRNPANERSTRDRLGEDLGGGEVSLPTRRSIINGDWVPNKRDDQADYR